MCCVIMYSFISSFDEVRVHSSLKISPARPLFQQLFPPQRQVSPLGRHLRPPGDISWPPGLRSAPLPSRGKENSCQTFFPHLHAGQQVFLHFCVPARVKPLAAFRFVQPAVAHFGRPGMSTYEEFVGPFADPPVFGTPFFAFPFCGCLGFPAACAPVFRTPFAAFPVAGTPGVPPLFFCRPRPTAGWRS